MQPTINLVLLAAACLIAYARPVWGLLIILIVTSTLFHLHQYLTVPLPIGYIEPTEALLSTMVIAVWLRRHTGRSIAPDASVRCHACTVIAPYCIWQIFCIAVGLTQSAETDLRFIGRAFLSEVIPWTSLYILVALSAEEKRQIFRGSYYLTLITACLHIILQLVDYRPIMKAAYYYIPATSGYDFSWLQHSIDTDPFVRGLPQGLDLILFFTLLKLAEYILAPTRPTMRNLSGSVLLFAALFITVTRSLMMVLAAGVVLMLGLALLTVRVKAGQAIRMWSILGLFVITALTYNAVRPGFLDFWAERINELAGADSAIFSQENKARGLDNIASMNAIRDQPLLGFGMGRAPGEYSLRDGPPTDTHPMLEIGLTGGIPAMVLILLLQVRLFLPSLRAAFSDAVVARELVPFISVLAMNALALNMAGGGGTIAGPSILYITIFASEMWDRWPSAVKNRKDRQLDHGYLQSRREQGRAIAATLDLGHNTFI